MKTTALTINIEEARAAFAQWWKDYTDKPESFGSDPDLDGRDSAELFFQYVERARSGK